MAIVRSITHWTGGTNRASSKDKKHYHRITEGDGAVVNGLEKIEDNIVTSDGDYAAHTLNLNTGSAGFAMAGMHGAKESPYDPGEYPLREVQFEAHCKMLARFHLDYDILPITSKNCLTHAEVEPNLGVKQNAKWDITRLEFKPELRGARAVGDYMRSRVKAYLGMVDNSEDMAVNGQWPILRQGMRGAYVQELQTNLKTLNYFFGKIDGVFGKLTKEAVLGFQNDVGLMTDGVVGAQTWARLMEAKPRPKRNITEAELKKDGSQTIAVADKGQAVATIGGGIAVVTGILEGITTATDSLVESQGALDAAMALATEYWPVLLALGAAGIAYRYFGQIKATRVDDAQTGKHLGR